MESPLQPEEILEIRISAELKEIEGELVKLSERYRRNETLLRELSWWNLKRLKLIKEQGQTEALALKYSSLLHYQKNLEALKHVNGISVQATH